MKPFTKAEIKNAQSVSLVDYCQAKGIELEGSPENPHLKEMDSLVLFPGNVKRQWQRFSTSEGGDAIKFVEYYYQLPFQEAVKELLSPEYQLNQNQHLSQPMPSSPFIYQNYEVKDFSHALRYLTQERKIDPRIVTCLHEKGYLAQDQRDNIVFKWKNQLTGEICGANIQGSRKTEGRSFKLIQRHSTPGYGFNLINGQPQSLYFFESSIDLLSYCDLHQGNLSDKWFVSMEGLKKNVVVQTLANFNQLRVKNGESISVPPSMNFCVDHDEAGQNFYDKYFKNYEYCHYLPPNHGKDWNDELVFSKSQEQVIQKLPNQSLDISSSVQYFETAPPYYEEELER